MAARRNPYDWQSHHPEVEIPRAEVDAIAEVLAEGGSAVAVVLGGRGMGKSVFLRQLRGALERDGEIRVVVISAPPPETTVRACLDQLARHFEVPPGAFNSQAIVDAYFARDGVPKRLVLLFDEFDRYARKGEPAEAPGHGFFNDLEATRRDTPGLGVMPIARSRATGRRTFRWASPRVSSIPEEEVRAPPVLALCLRPHPARAMADPAQGSGDRGSVTRDQLEHIVRAAAARGARFVYILRQSNFTDVAAYAEWPVGIDEDNQDKPIDLASRKESYDDAQAFANYH